MCTVYQVRKRECGVGEPAGLEHHRRRERWRVGEMVKVNDGAVGG